VKFKQIRIEAAVYLLIFAFAVFLRFLQLGEQPVTEMEAANALQALSLSNGGQVLFRDHAAYVLLTGVLFFLLEANDFLMRFWPALAGSLLVFAPIFFRKYLANTAALILALGIAIDPILIFQSRLASGDVLSVVFVILTLGFLVNKMESGAGIFTALAIISGSGAWYGLSAGILAVGGVLILGKWIRRDGPPILAGLSDQFQNWCWKQFFIWFGAATILFSTLFWFVPHGLNGLFSGISGWLAGWSQVSGVSLDQIFGALVFYETLPLILGLVAIGLLILRHEPLDLILVSLIIFSFLLLIIYPGRQFSYLSWVVLPLWVLIARKLSQHLLFKDLEIIPYVGMVVIILVAFVFAGLNFKALFNGMAVDTVTMQLRIAGIIGSLFLIPLLSAVVIWGWTWETAWRALLTGIILALLILNTSSVSRIYSPKPEMEQKLLFQKEFLDRDLLEDTISDFVLWNKTTRKAKIVVYNLQSSALDWSLKDQQTSKSLSLPAATEPEMLISSSVEQLALEEAYTGQAFVLTQTPLWEDLTLVDWLRWYVTHRAPTIDESIILWVRSDLFPGYENNAIK